MEYLAHIPIGFLCVFLQNIHGVMILLYIFEQLSQNSYLSNIRSYAKCPRNERFARISFIKLRYKKYIRLLFKIIGAFMRIHHQRFS